MGKVSLAKLSDEHRDYFAYLIANQVPLTKAVKQFQAEFKDVHKYSVTSFRKYLQTEEAKEAIINAKEKIREEAKEHLFSDRPGRVAILAEVAGRILVELRAIPDSEVSGGPFKSLARELRDTLREIRSEMEVFGETGAGLDLFASMINSFSQMQQAAPLPDFIQQAIDESTDKLSIS
jgi:hypothetical protein